MTTTANFTIDQVRIAITLNVERDYFSLTGQIAGGSSGQCRDEIEKLHDECAEWSPPLIIVLDAWKTYHLKPLGEVPKQVFMDTRSALMALDGEDFPEAEGGNADEFEEADFSENDDMIDSSDIIARIEYLRAFLADLPDDISPETYDPDADKRGDRSEAVKEYGELRDLEEDGESYAPDWSHGETLINEDYFTTYAEELIKDIGDLPNNIPGYIAIDWETTANNLKVDYTEISFRGSTFLIR